MEKEYQVVLNSETCPLCDGAIEMHAEADLSWWEFPSVNPNNDAPMLRVVHGGCARAQPPPPNPLPPFDFGSGKSGIFKR